MPDVMGMFDSRFLGCWDLVDRDGKPREYTLIVAKVEGGELQTGTGEVKRKPVVHFRGAKKPLALNKTNAKAIIGMYGRKTENWIGRPVTVYPTTTKVGKDPHVPCIRVRPSAPKGPAVEAPLGAGPVDAAVRAQQQAAITEAEREPGQEG